MLIPGVSGGSMAMILGIYDKLLHAVNNIIKDFKNQYKILRDGYEGGSIIVECGFLSNHEEEQRLKDSNHQDKIVEGIALGIEKYFEDNT